MLTNLFLFTICAVNNKVWMADVSDLNLSACSNVIVFIMI